MPEVPTGLGPSTSHDRLNALRQNSQSPVSAVTPRKVRIELLVGAAAFLAVIAVLFVLLGSRVQQTSSVMTVPVAKSPVEGELPSGQALIPLALEEGSFPPHVEVGDQVRIIVSPSSDGTGTTRRLEEETVVQSISGPSDIGGRSVVTVRGPESVAVAISASGPIHIAIVHEAKP